MTTVSIDDINCQDILQQILELFDIHISDKEYLFNQYCYNNHKCIDNIVSFINDVKALNIMCDKTYHAHSIGNNNEKILYIEKEVENGVKIRIDIARFYYCRGIYGGCYVSLTDLQNQEVLRAVAHAR